LITGSPAILGDREEDGGADNDANDFKYNSETQTQKQKIAERMLSWQMAYGRGEEVDAPNYDKEVSHNHIPRLTGAQEVVQLVSSLIFFFHKISTWTNISQQILN
jgi:cellulose synthase A